MCKTFTTLEHISTLGAPTYLHEEFSKDWQPTITIVLIKLMQVGSQLEVSAEEA